MAKEPAIANKNRQVREYPLASSQTFRTGAAVVLVVAAGGNQGRLTECGADPTQILGFSLHAAGVDPDPSACLVILAYPESTFWLEGSRAPLMTDQGLSFGISRDADGDWFVDTAKTGTSARVQVEKVDLTRNLFEVKVLPANRQLP